MEYLVQIEEYGRVVYNRRHRGASPAVALRRALDQSNTKGPAEAYVANPNRTVWTYTVNRGTASVVSKRQSIESPTSLLSGNIRLSMSR